MDFKVLSTGIPHSSLPDSYVRPESERPRLSEVRTCENVPLIDLGATNQLEIIQQIGDACRDYGFFQVNSHGVTVELTAKMSEIAHELYSDDPTKTMSDCVLSVRDSPKSMKETSQEASTHSGKRHVAEKNHLTDLVEKKDDGARTDVLSATEKSEEAIFTTIKDLLSEMKSMFIALRSLQALLGDPRGEKEGVSQTGMETSLEEIMFRTEMPKTKQEAVTNKVLRIFDNPWFDTMLVSFMVGDCASIATMHGTYQMDKGKSDLALPALSLVNMFSAGITLKLLYFLLHHKYPKTGKFFAILGLTSSIGAFLSMAAAMCPRSMLSFFIFICQGIMIVAALVTNLI